MTKKSDDRPLREGDGAVIQFERLMGLRLPDVVRSYSRRDVILYALSVGVGADPVDPDQLRFVYEKDLRVLPTFAAILGHVGLWTRHPDAGIDANHVLHGEHAVVFHRPIQPEGRVLAHWRIVDIVDKGKGQAALIYTATELSDADSGERLATIAETVIARADGGFGGPPRPSRSQLPAIPGRAPDHVCDMTTLPQAALLYRLNGDENPLHCDPDYAAAAGFPKPVLHGLATFGFAGHAVLKSLCGYDPASIASLGCRFIAPAFPGDTLHTEVWREGDAVHFRTQAGERGSVLLIGWGRLNAPAGL